MLIDVSYFTEGPRHILNASPNTLSEIARGQNSLAVNERIDSFIRYYQPLFLEKMLGASLASVVECYIDDKGNKDDDIEALLDNMREAFADYVYFYILRTANKKSSMTGHVVLKSDNKTASPNVEMCRAWNDMVDRNVKFVKWADKSPFDVQISESMLTHINTFGL